MTNYLGIDYGRSHIGLATADGILAWPCETIPNNEKSINLAANIAHTKNIDQIIIGLPEGDLDKEIYEFGKALSNLTNLPIIYHPETLTTQEATSKLRETKAKKKKLSNEHIYAACLILEDYLESQD